MADVITTTNEARAKRIAVDRIVGFAKQFGEEHLNLACHGAFPLALTPDLLYQIWANFVPRSPWTAVARVLLSRLCREVGYEMYEMDIAVRNLLLKELKEQFRQKRFEELADFLIDYVEQRLNDDDPDTRDLAQAQKWTALAYTKPSEAAREFAQAIGESVKHKDMAEVFRLGSLVKTFEDPLQEAGFYPLLIYARGMVSFASGDLKNATGEIRKLRVRKHAVRVAGVNVPVPKNIFDTLSPQPEEPVRSSPSTIDYKPTSIVDTEIPFLQNKRTDITEKFTSILMFAEKYDLKVSEWVRDSQLEANMKRCVSLHPEKSETDWISYFLDVLLDVSQPMPEREIARKHLWCFYQETIFWATREFYLKFRSQTNLWSWEELFDKAADTFATVKNAARDLRHLNPEIGSKKYVKQLLYRNITNWRDGKIGRNSMITQINLEANQSSLEDNDYSLSREIKIEQAMIEQTLVKEENYRSKRLQEQVLSAITRELDKVEDRAASAIRIGKTNISLWEVLLLTYGLNLNHSGTAMVLTLNQQPINQSTINRHIKHWVVKLQLALLEEVAKEINEFMGEFMGDSLTSGEGIESTPIFQDWSKRKQREVEDCLKDYLNQRMFDLVIPEKESIRKLSSLQEDQAIIRSKLDEWFVDNMNISMHSGILTDSLEKKINQVVMNWAKALLEY